MTRKQAIIKVLSVFGNIDAIDDKELHKALKILEEMKNGTPGKIWDENNIMESIERFKEENGRYPTTKELDTCYYLPPHPVVANVFNMTAGEWLHLTFPDYKEVNATWKYLYGFITEDDLKNIFIEEFNRNNPSSSVEYNKKRKHATPSWQFIAKKLGVNTWNELKELCVVEYEEPKPNFNVIAQFSGID